MKYEVITAPFYCLKLDRVFVTGEIVEIEDTERAKELVDSKMLKVVKTTKSRAKKKVTKDE